MNDIKKTAPKKPARATGEVSDTTPLKAAKAAPKSAQKENVLAAEPKKAAPKKSTRTTTAGDTPGKVGTAKSAPKRTKKFTVIPAERHAMIAEAAYFRAEQHGFTGDPHMYWLEAEAEIDKKL